MSEARGYEPDTQRRASAERMERAGEVGGESVGMKRVAFILGGLAVALVLAGLVSPFAASAPDGLEYTLHQGCTVGAGGEIVDGTCPAEATEDHPLAGSPLSDYGLRGLDSDVLGTGLSGVIGVLLTFAVGGGLFWLVRRRGRAAKEV